MRSTSITCLLAALFAAAVQAADDDRRIHINADSMQLDINSGTSTYLGNVVFRRGDVELRGERIVIDDRAGDRRVRVSGDPARFEQTTAATRASARDMLYEERSGILTLQQDARLDHNNQLVESQQIRYNTVEKSLLAGASQDSGDKGRVNIILDTGEGDR